MALLQTGFHTEFSAWWGNYLCISKVQDSEHSSRRIFFAIDNIGGGGGLGSQSCMKP